MLLLLLLHCHHRYHDHHHSNDCCCSCRCCIVTIAIMIIIIIPTIAVVHVAALLVPGQIATTMRKKTIKGRSAEKITLLRLVTVSIAYIV
jgi:hypothetical protein